MHTIRPLNWDTDLPRVAEIFSQVSLEPATAAQLTEWWGRVSEGEIRHRLVLTDADGQIVAYGMTGRTPWDKPGRFWVSVMVDRARRQQGFGTHLYDHLVGLAVGQGATRLDAEIRENQPAGVRFAEQRGFRRLRHNFESTLRLADFDPAPFAGVVEAVKASGIRFSSLGAMGDTQAAREKLYDINRRMAYDIPGWDSDFPPFERFAQNVFEASWYRPEGQLVALDGERWVGMAAIGFFQESNSLYNMMTGVEAEYRGRQIALALKLLSIELARQLGAVYIRTNNDALNAPMLAINRKLGYQPVPGLFWMVKDLATSA